MWLRGENKPGKLPESGHRVKGGEVDEGGQDGAGQGSFSAVSWLGLSINSFITILSCREQSKTFAISDSATSHQLALQLNTFSGR